jgi:FkbM family methyltransferase
MTLALFLLCIALITTLNLVSNKPTNPTTTSATKTDAVASSYASDGQSQAPLQIFPLLKEMRTGWANLAIPLPLKRKVPEGMRALVVDVGLDKGDEFFFAIRQGFEVVGFEPNPVSFNNLKTLCQNGTEFKHRCVVIDDVDKVELPLQRQVGVSYLLHAGAGSERANLELSLEGPGGSFAKLDGNQKAEKATVPVVRVDDIISDDVFLFKIDTQGYDYNVLLGSSKLFQNFAVRQVVTEFEPYSYQQVTGHDSVGPFLKLLQHEYGMICFTDRSDNAKECEYLGDTVEGYDQVFFKRDGSSTKVASKNKRWATCWDDFLCLNVGKTYPHARIPPLA